MCIEPWVLKKLNNGINAGGYVRKFENSEPL